MIAPVAHRHLAALLTLDADLARVADVVCIDMDDATPRLSAPVGRLTRTAR